MFGEKIEKRILPVVAHTTSGLRVEGGIHIHPSIRLIDEMNQPERVYLAISSAGVTFPVDGGIESFEFVILNKREIVCIAPLDAGTDRPVQPAAI